VSSEFDQVSTEDARNFWQRYRWWFIGLGALVLLGLCVFWLQKLMAAGEEPRKKKVIQEIALMKPPPPPPPPKTPPPPPKEQVREKMDIPKPDAAPTKSEAPPPGPDLAVDAAGTGAGDGFGLVGKKGGADLIAGGGGGTGNKFAWYGALLKDRIQDAIARDKKLREAGEFQRNVNVWVSASGQVTRAEIVGAGDKPELEEAIRAVIKAMSALREGAPGDMPQPIRLRIASR
jgi:protein TonB